MVAYWNYYNRSESNTPLNLLTFKNIELFIECKKIHVTISVYIDYIM